MDLIFNFINAQMKIYSTTEKRLNKMKVIVLTLLVAIAFTEGFMREEEHSPLPVVKDFELSKVMGHWYTIASYSHIISRLCYCAQTDYTLNTKGDVISQKSCHLFFDWGPVIHSTSYNHVNKKVKAKWVMEYSYGPFKVKGESWIIEMDKKYEWVVLASPDRDNLWILSRFKSLSVDLLNNIFERLTKKGLDVKRIVFIDQTCK
jgi:apolipoprotein D and lipocalin family protein